MRRNKIITMCLWRRPDYTRQILDALSKCPEVGNYTLLIYVDGGGCEQVLSLARGVKFCPVRVTAATSHLGCNRNTHRALSGGFRHSDYVIHLEDDILLARDALTYFEWASQFSYLRKVFSVGTWPHKNQWNPHGKAPKYPNHDNLVGISPGFHVWGWATWFNRWREIDSNWTNNGDKELSWDTQITQNVRKDRGSLVPYLSRCQNIGEKDGTHRGAFILTRWSESPDAEVCHPPKYQIDFNPDTVR